MHTDSPLDRKAGRLGPGAHAAMDYAAAAALAGLGLYLRGRNQRASTYAFANAGAVVLVSMFTDYPGGWVRRLRFKTHGILDVIQATALAAGPHLLGFADRSEARIFYVQAGLEAAVVSATDWSARAGQRRSLP